MSVHGLLLAAGEGRRMGRPKALVDDWLARGVGVLREGGCSGVTVVLGAAADRARALVPADARVVVAGDWAEGMGASLRAGLEAVGTGSSTTVDAVLVHLVDLPDVSTAVIERVLGDAAGPDVLRRASYDGSPGHPVLLGRRHWPGITAVARGDRGARDYLAAHEHEVVECGDLATGEDVDTRA